MYSNIYKHYRAFIKFAHTFKLHVFGVQHKNIHSFHFGIFPGKRNFSHVNMRGVIICALKNVPAKNMHAGTESLHLFLIFQSRCKFQVGQKVIKIFHNHNLGQACLLWFWYIHIHSSMVAGLLHLSSTFYWKLLDRGFLWTILQLTNIFLFYKFVCKHSYFLLIHF